MCGLHRRDYAKLGEAGNILGGEHLSVLDAQSRIARRRRLAQGLGVSIECPVVGGITDGVSAYLKALFERSQRQVVDCGLRGGDHALALGSIAVGSEQSRSTRSQCAVGKKLEGADGQPVVAIDLRTT